MYPQQICTKLCGAADTIEKKGSHSKGPEQAGEVSRCEPNGVQQAKSQSAVPESG